MYSNWNMISNFVSHIKTFIRFDGFVLDFEFRLANSANEAVSFDLLYDVSGSRSFIGERVDDDTEEDVHEDNVDDHEEGEIEPISEPIIFIRNVSLPKSISNTTSTSHSKTSCGHQAIGERRAIHVVRTSWRNRCVILIVIGTGV